MTEKSPSDLQDKFMVRMPEGMRDEIKRSAAEAGRSMNSEIIFRLENFPKLAAQNLRMKRIAAPNMPKEPKEAIVKAIVEDAMKDINRLIIETVEDLKKKGEI